MLTILTKTKVHWACVLNTLPYGSESCSPYAHQESRLNAFHQHCLRKILNESWQDHLPNTEILEGAQIPSMYALLS